MEALSDAQLATKTADFKRLVQSGKSLDELLPEAFAVVREASKRVLNMRHYDVQLVSMRHAAIWTASAHQRKLCQ